MTFSKSPLLLLAVFLMVTVNGLTHPTTCRSVPGAASWPGPGDWTALNTTLHGRLVPTIPIGATCHRRFISPFTNISTYDEEECSALRNVWFFPDTHLASSSSPMAYSFSNNSCNPWLEPDVPCTLGDHVVYAINATDHNDIQLGIEFAKNHNIRLVIRNTGHDYLGRSTGAHALALWTHNMKSLKLVKYRGATAIKIGAGVQAIEAYTFANIHGLVVVGGNCPTVGIAGGFTQGGGHGPLSSAHGLGADQVLEWEVVLADGRLVTANNAQNPDLFWALRGGGPGTYGVVVSMTVKTYPDTYASSAYFSVLDNGTNTDTIYQAIGSWLNILPSIVDTGVFALWIVNPAGFFLMPAFGSGMHQHELDRLLQPALDIMTELHLDYEYSSSEEPTFLLAYESLTSSWNVSDYNTGGRLISRDVVRENTTAVVKAIRHIASQTLFSSVSFNVKHAVSSPDEVAVNPYFREALFNVFLGIPINYQDAKANKAGEDQITHDFLPALAAITPNGGAYMNEADVEQPDFQSVFYGAHYKKLLEIKRQYDPEGIFYVKTGVGSDSWEEQIDGRLCRTNVI